MGVGEEEPIKKKKKKKKKQEPCRLVKGQGHSSLLNVVIRLQCPANNFVMLGGILKKIN